MIGQSVQLMYQTQPSLVCNGSDNTFGKGFSWKDAPWFDANGLKDVAAINQSTV